jgi:hypothetical protein
MNPKSPIRNPSSITLGISGSTIRFTKKEIIEKVPDILIKRGNRNICTAKVATRISLRALFAGINF